MSKAASDGRLIIADLYSRPNALNGKYKAARIGLDNLSYVNDKDLYLLQTLRMTADLADKLIAEAELQGRDPRDPKIIEELGAKINSLGAPLRRTQRLAVAALVCFQLVVVYAVAAGIWGAALKQGALIYGVCGMVLGAVVSLSSVAPVVAFQRTERRMRDIVLHVSMTWGVPALIVGAFGLIALVIRLVAF